MKEQKAERWNEADRKEIVIPFMGFYETPAADQAEQLALYEWTDLDISGFDPDKELEGIESLTVEQAEKFWGWYADNRQGYELEVARTYMHNLFGEIKDKTGVDLKPYSETLIISSPREYNFTTDRLFVEVSIASLFQLYHKVDQDILAETIRDNFTSYDGFISHYSNDINSDEWRNLAEWDHNRWLTLIEAICKQYEINTDEVLYG